MITNYVGYYDNYDNNNKKVITIKYYNNTIINTII